MTEPVEMYAHVPGVLSAYGKLEQATAMLHRVDERLKVLAELEAATLTNCEYCIDPGSHDARRSGLTDEQLLALPRYRESGLFDDVENREPRARIRGRHEPHARGGSYTSRASSKYLRSSSNR